MKAKKFFVGTSALLAMFINFPQVSADEVVTFGEEFENDNNSKVVPFQDENSDDEDFGPVLIFNDPEKLKNENPSKDSSENPAEIEEKPETESDNEEKILVIDKNSSKYNISSNYDNENYDNERILPPSKINENRNEKQKKLKTQKPRFIKLAMDENYIYYLDKQSVSWQRIPYSASEYMLDVWVRMIEINPDNSDIPADLAEYFNDTTNGEIEIAREKGKAFAPVDVDVLQHKKYFLEHYYLRPKTKQIQFLSELEVVGHPQNTVSQRAYDYKNWEYLIPGSIESIIYNATIKEVGKSGSSENGHMSFADMLEEYARISIR